MNQMVNENVGFNDYAFMNKSEKSSANSQVYALLKAAYDTRDMSKFGRLSFEEYVKGITPQERYATEYKRENPSEGAKMWNETFGEDMDLMKRAAISHHQGLPVSKGLYRQGE